MRFSRIVCALSLVLSVPFAHAQTPWSPLRPEDRILIIAPHPDDEVLACGGLIQHALKAGAAVRVVYLTHGDHNQIAFKLSSGKLFMSGRTYRQFGERRRAEALAATALLGLKPDQLVFLGFPDWGLLPMWRDYWDAPKPFRSDATRTNAVPYREDFAWQQPYRPEAILASLKSLLDQFRPTHVFAPHPADTNPDHRASANFVRLAFLELEPTGLRPQLFFYAVHFGDWPKPCHYHPDVPLRVPAALRDEGSWFQLALSRPQTEAKYAAILQNATQLTTRHYYLVAFARLNELFARLPTETIPILPADAVPDWPRAVRNRAIALDPSPPRGQRNGGSTEPEPLPISLKETRFFQQDDNLIAAIDFHSRLGPRSNVHLFLYGYAHRTDFATLPKIHINVNPLGHLHVYDDDRRPLTDHGVTKTAVVADKLVLRVPLRLLGGHALEYLFTATRANLRQISPDDSAWRLYRLPAGGQRG